MVVSQASIFLFTFFIIAVLVVMIKKDRANQANDTVVYSLGFSEFEESGNDEDHEVSGLLRVVQYVKKVDDNENLTVAQVEFPMNGQDYVVMLVKVLNYNSKISTEELVKYRKEDSRFWILMGEGAIGSNSVTVEINSYENIDIDVEFYGYKEDKKATTTEAL